MLTLATNEVWGFLKQTNISARNIARLESLSSIKDAAFQKFRRLVLEIARVRPRKRQRWKNVRREYPDLYRKVVAAGWFSEYDLDERLDHPELPRDVEEADWDALDPDERQGILAHSRHDSTCDSSLAE